MNLKTKNNIENLKKEASEQRVPIICDEGLAFLLDTIKANNVKTVLEIGTAVGYSAINMALMVDRVDTFERDEMMISQAKSNIANFNLEHKITLISADALLFDGDLQNYDLIFIDAAKAQYEKFFTKYAKNLNKSGVIVCDNLNFHNLKESEVSRQTRQLLRKINKFREFLKENIEYETTFFNVGDGMSISKRR